MPSFSVLPGLKAFLFRHELHEFSPIDGAKIVLLIRVNSWNSCQSPRWSLNQKPFREIISRNKIERSAHEKNTVFFAGIGARIICSNPHPRAIREQRGFLHARQRGKSHL